MKVDSPFGTVESTQDPNQAARNVGVDVYPGATLRKNGSANVAFGNIHSATAEFETDDPVASVAAFYGSKFPAANVTTSGERTTILAGEKGNMTTIVIEPQGGEDPDPRCEDHGQVDELLELTRAVAGCPGRLSRMQAAAWRLIAEGAAFSPPASNRFLMASSSSPDQFAARANAAKSAVVDRAALGDALRRQVRGEVRFDDGSRALYATDGSNYRQVPIGVVLPRDVDDVLAAVSIAHQYGAPILCRGGGTSLAGQCCNVAVVLDFSKYMAAILEIDPERRIARVQPGVVLDDLRNAAERHHLTFAPDPATHSRCTLGGMIGNNSCGVHSIMAGKTDDNIEELDVLTYDGLRMKVGRTSDQELDSIVGQRGRRGEIYSGLKFIADHYGRLVREHYPAIPRRVSGYNLDRLLPENGFQVAQALVGSEGTCVTVLEATCRLVESPPGARAAGDCLS